MSILEISVLQNLAKKAVRRANNQGTLSALTPRMIRGGIEKQLSLEPKSLDEKVYKEVIRTAISDAQESLSDCTSGSGPEDEPEDEPPQPKSKAKAKSRKSEASDASSGKKRKADDTESSARKKKKHATTDGSKKGTQIKKVTQPFKSAEFVPPSSDVEGAHHESLFSAEESTPQKPPKKPSKKPLRLSSPDIQDKPSSSKRESISTSAAPDHGEDLKNESELSVLIDEPPKRKKATKTKEKATSFKAGGSSSKSSKEQKDNKHEDRIKKLKSLVLACGVRKVWSRVFKGIEDQPSQQIKILQSILTDLGMTGRMSMEQAKAIRARRELAEELAEVQSFEKSVLKQRSSRSKGQADSEKESSTEEEEEMPVKRKPKNARQSIMAFLEDQSESE